MTLFSDQAYFLTGPTASGKTALALEWAEKRNAEILSMDAYAIYCGMDIGTAKPTREERARVPHHLMDLVEPSAEFSVADYVAAAETAVRDILARGRAPLFVGGTPLYLKALLFGLFDSPPADLALRESLRLQAENALQAGDATFLHRQLQACDPQTAARLHPNDTKRLIRALEVFQLTGQPIHAFQTQFAREVPPEVLQRIHLVEIPRAELRQRIDLRVEQMFAQGLLDEVAALAERYPQLSLTAAAAVGYREIFPFLEAQRRGETPSLDELKETIKANTRHVAKRQCTWFRSLLNRPTYLQD